MSFSEMHERRKGRNMAMMVILLCFVALSAAVAFIKLPDKVAERRDDGGSANHGSADATASGAYE